VAVFIYGKAVRKRTIIRSAARVQVR